MSSGRVLRAFSSLGRQARVSPARGLSTIAAPSAALLSGSALSRSSATAVAHREIAGSFVAFTTRRGLASAPGKSGVVDGSDESLEKLTGKGRSVIDFSATWCGPCKVISPVFAELSNKYADSGIKFVNVDVDDNPESAMKYQVSAVPTFAFVQDGQLVGQIRGADAAGLERMIAQFATMK